MATAACIVVAPTGPTAPGNTVAASAAPDLQGNYSCSIADQGYSYDAFPCVIHRNGPLLELTKLAGSQRFAGHIEQTTTNGFTFTGKFFCPQGACDQGLHGTFQVNPDGTWTGRFTDSTVVVTLARATGGFGGASYGGFGYGGNSYGGGTIPRP